MHDDRHFDPHRRGRRLRIVAVVGVGTLAMGSCTGALLGHYTVTGMNPFYGSQSATIAVAERRETEDSYDWPRLAEAKAEVPQAGEIGDDATY